MRRYAPHLVIVVGTLLLLYVSSPVEQALHAARSRTFTEAWGLFTVRFLLLATTGWLLALPHWWQVVQRRRGLVVNVGILSLYALPGLVFTAASSLSGVALVLGSWIDLWMLYRGGGQLVGGLLIGFGIGQSLTSRETARL